MADLEWDRNFALEQSGDDEEVLAELLALYRDSSSSDLARINEGLAAGDSSTVADAAHSIKGASASLGIGAVVKVAAALEKAGRAGDRAAFAGLTAHLTELLAAFNGQS